MFLFALRIDLKVALYYHNILPKWAPGALLPGIKRPGREVDHSYVPSAEVENDGAIPPTPHISSWQSLTNYISTGKTLPK
jgi:hypothetical protein